MSTDTPPGWLERAAELNPDGSALILREGVVSFADLDHQVNLRARSMAPEGASGAITPIPVRLDLSSIIEVLAAMRSGRVPLPYLGEYPDMAHTAPSGTAVCVATSGSQGRSRIVPLSYANIASSVEASRSRLGNGPTDRWLATLPLHHIGGLSVIWRSLEAGGAAVVAPFDQSVRSVLAAARPTFASLVPTMVHRLLAMAPDELAAIAVVLTGGARLGSALQVGARERGVSLVASYGMTETCSQIATAVPGSSEKSADVVGPLLDGFSVTIRHLDDRSETPEVGVIEVEGPAVFRGYVGEGVRREPFVTSDLGFMTTDGDLAVVGRRDDIVVSGGENVSLSGVSSVIEDVAGVLDVAVVGIPDDEWGTAVCAVVAVESHVSEGDVVEAISASLPPHAIPRHLEFGRIPLLTNGKHDVAAVRQRFARQ